MSQRRGWIGCGVLLVGLLLGCFGTKTTQAQHEKLGVARGAKPNIVFIFADDHAYEAIGAFKRTDIDTPNLDRLVAGGTTFTHAYNMGSWSGAVCVASRTMLNTGRFIWRAHQVYNTTETERAEGRFWSEILKKNGYRTYMTGKWHVRAKADKAFDVLAHERPGMPKQTKTGYNRPLSDGTDPWDPADPKFGGFWEGGRHWSEIVADDAEAFMKEAADRTEPFFMYLAFNAPHDPRQAPQSYLDKYPVSRIEVPSNFLPAYPYANEARTPWTLRDENLAPNPRTPHSVQVHRREYYALIEHMDAQIGRILKALESTGKLDNTYIFFTADHGLAVGHHGLMGKQNMYDHSLRVPFMVAGPGVPKGARRSTPIYLQDVMPTTLDLAGIPKPDHVEFQSLTGLISDDSKASAYDAIYGAYLDAQRCVIAEGHKLILYPAAKKVRLYDLEADPDEAKDLSDQASKKPLMKKLFARLLALQKDLEDAVDLRSTFADLAP